MSTPETPRYWKSFEERAGDPVAAEAARNEFPALPAAGEGGAPRREFMKLTGFSLIGGIFGGLWRPRVEQALPYDKLPENSVPGRAYWYAGMCGACSAGCGVLAKVRDGRPIKLEGNPEHPVSRGGLCAVGQASILGLYDSRRALRPGLQGKPADWAAVDAEMINRLAGLRGGGAVRFLTGTVTSPAQRSAIAAFLSGFADGRHVQYDALSAAAILDAYAAAHGARVLPRYQFDQADVIAAFDADFLGTWISPVEYAAGHAARRAPATGGHGPLRMSHHTHVESRLSLTGARADERHVLHPSEIVHALARLAQRLLGRSGAALGFTPGATAMSDAALDALAERLWAARGKSLVVCGLNDMTAQLLVIAINQALGNHGTTVLLENPSRQKQGDDQAVAALLEELEAGKVGALFVAGCNPVYDLPEGERFAKAMAKAGLTVSFADRLEETASLCSAHCPEPHWLESWRDGETAAGIVTLAQPAMRRLGKTRTLLESLAAWRGEAKTDYALLREAWQSMIYPRQREVAAFDAFWDGAVQRGYAMVTPDAPKIAAYRQPEIPAPAAAATGMTVVCYPAVNVLEGREAENPWLQELPDPMTKVTWEHCASLSPALAEKSGIRDGDIVRVTAGKAAVELPAVIQPGMHPDVIAVPLGYGRMGTERFSAVGPKWISGKRARQDGERLGQAASPLLARVAGYCHAATAAALAKTGASRELARTQMHHSLVPPEHIAGKNAAARPIVRESTLEEWKKNGHGGHAHEEPSIWPNDHESQGHKWGMVIDLNACTGCGGCVVGCQVENNIPVVGWDEVRRGREMHWLRIDRYYSDRGDGGVDVAQQPMMCQHCDHAPCEVVCPVLATVHSSEGINQQVYNRCIGTRYCANNCPYKVRRFNWFDYAQTDPRASLVLNPDVTVRSRGVMEKCSFCVQRIQEAKAEAQRQGRELRDGDARSACQQSCPSRAIVFGDLNDPESEVARRAADPRAYKVLGEVGTRPAVSYLEVVRNRTE